MVVGFVLQTTFEKICLAVVNSEPSAARILLCNFAREDLAVGTSSSLRIGQQHFDGQK